MITSGFMAIRRGRLFLLPCSAWHDQLVTYIRTFGEIPGHPEGTTYRSRDELRRAGLHAHNQAGISGTPRDGADAIVLNGGYPDDCDEGDLIIYTG